MEVSLSLPYLYASSFNTQFIWHVSSGDCISDLLLIGLSLKNYLIMISLHLPPSFLWDCWYLMVGSLWRTPWIFPHSRSLCLYLITVQKTLMLWCFLSDGSDRHRPVFSEKLRSIFLCSFWGQVEAEAIVSPLHWHTSKFSKCLSTISQGCCMFLHVVEWQTQFRLLKLVLWFPMRGKCRKLWHHRIRTGKQVKSMGWT